MEMVRCQEALLHGRPFQKGSLYKLLPIFEVCIFMSKKELWKNTARREADFYRPMSNRFFISKILSVTVNMSVHVCTFAHIILQTHIYHAHTHTHLEGVDPSSYISYTLQ